MHPLFKIAAAAAVVAIASQAMARVTFYEGEGFGGRSFTTKDRVANLERFGFNDRASSAQVTGARWEVCEDTRFGGRCAILRPGRYPSLSAMGLNDRVSSVREVKKDARFDDARRRNPEKLFEADVTSVRAVVGAPEQRCWIEREQVAQEQSRTNVPAAIVGAVIGGILGHQVGAGRGKDLATVGGVIAGGAVGATIGRDGQRQAAATRDVQRCESQASNAKPEYWDVTYVFQGQEHRVQMTAPPGRSVTVNRNGEPRA